MKTAKTNWIGTILSCLCDMAGFVTITYLLGCADFSFSKSPVSILLFAANCWLYSLFWQNLRRYLSRGTAILVTILAFGCVAALLYFVGFLPFGTEPVRLPLF